MGRKGGEGGRRRGTWAGVASRRRGRGRRRRRRGGSRASELVRVLVVEEEDDGGPPGRLGWSWGGRRPRASRVGGRGGGGAGEPERVWRGMEGDLAREREGGIGRRAGYPAIEGGMLVMAHHLGVRHKNTDSNGAPSSGAPLVTFFLIAMAHPPLVRH